MGNKSSLPKYEEIPNDEIFYEEQDPCALEKLNKMFDDIINTPIVALETIEGKIFNLIVTAKTFSLIIPSKILPYTDYTKLTNSEKIEYVRFNLELIAAWLGKNFIIT